MVGLLEEKVHCVFWERREGRVHALLWSIFKYIGGVVEMGVENVMVGRVLVRIVVNEMDRIELRKDG